MRQTVVLKVGGAVAHAEGALLGLQPLVAAGFGVVIVHGGGKEVSRWMDRLAVPVRFKNGLRVTDAASMELATMVLRGKVSTALAGALVRAGVKAVGLSGVDGGLLRLRPHADADLGFVGEVRSVDTALLNTLLADGYVPIVAPIAEDAEGVLRNINADSVCGAIAAALEAEFAVFLTDVAGVLDEAGEVIPAITADHIRSLIDNGTIHGGMVPKVNACLAALAHGARAACIADGRDPRILAPLLDGGPPSGTVIEAHSDAAGAVEEGA